MMHTCSIMYLNAEMSVSVRMFSMMSPLFLEKLVNNGYRYMHIFFWM